MNPTMKTKISCDAAALCQACEDLYRARRQADKLAMIALAAGFSCFAVGVLVGRFLL